LLSRSLERDYVAEQQIVAVRLMEHGVDLERELTWIEVSLELAPLLGCTRLAATSSIQAVCTARTRSAIGPGRLILLGGVSAQGCADTRSPA
jgi:hypothetical protein